jgi:isocitrate dehydrogenase (NAD+)
MIKLQTLAIGQVLARAITTRPKRHFKATLVRPGSFNEKSMPTTKSLHDVTLIPGYNIGPTMTRSLLEIFAASNAPVKFQTIERFDWDNMKHRISLRANRHIIMGNILGTRDDFYLENLPFYKYLGLSVKVIHHLNLPNIKTRYQNINFALVRANLEEIKTIDFEVYPGVYQSLSVVTDKLCMEIATHAFQYAQKNEMIKVACLTHPELAVFTQSLLTQSCREVSRSFPHIKYEEINTTKATIDFASNSQRNYKTVFLVGNVAGIIFSAMGAGLVGSENITAGINYGKYFRLFEQGIRPQVGEFRRSTGVQNINPTGLIMSGVNLLRDLGEDRHADLVESALYGVYGKGRDLPRNVGGECDSDQFTKVVVREIERCRGEGEGEGWGKKVSP